MLNFSTQLPLPQSLRSHLTGRSALWQFKFALNHHRFGSESSQFEQKAKSTPMLLWSLFSVTRWQSRWISTRWTKAAGCHTYQACIQTRSCDPNIAAATKQTPTAPRSQHGPCLDVFMNFFTKRQMHAWSTKKNYLQNLFKDVCNFSRRI